MAFYLAKNVKINPSRKLPILRYLSVYPSIYLSIYLSVYLSVCLSPIINPSFLYIDTLYYTVHVHYRCIGNSHTAAVSSPSEVIAGWNGLVAGVGRREVSSHILTAVPAAMAAPSTVISRKSGRTVCVYVCVCV